MVVFIYFNLEGSCFFDGSWGVFYVGYSVIMVVEEMVYYCECFFVVMVELLCDLLMCCYCISIIGCFYDLCGGWLVMYDLVDYIVSVVVVCMLCEVGFNGIVYDSVCYVGGECVVVFYLDLFVLCVQFEYFVY